jgi:predicted enzyme related to lactoylglutathione lyase
MLNFNSILLSTENLEKLAEFYQKVFEKEPEMLEANYVGFLVGSAFFSLGSHDKIKGKNPNPDRILFNFETKEVKKEFERIKGIGARVIKEPYTMEGFEGFWISTLADPDGNYFQLVTPWEEDKK